MGLRLATATIALFLPLELVPWTGTAALPTPAERVTQVAGGTFLDRWADELESDRRVAGVSDVARSHVEIAWHRAVALQSRPRTNHTLDDAAGLIRFGHYEHGRSLALVVAASPPTEAVEHRALDIAALAALETARPGAALAALIDRLDTPDALRWVRTLWAARAAEQLGSHALAHELAQRVVSNAPREFIVHEARVLTALSLLGVPDEERRGVTAVEAVLTRYPEYPYRDRAIIAMAKAEARAGDVRAATERLDRLLWERPHGGRASEVGGLLDALRERGGTTAERTPGEWLAQGRELRLARHWDFAERYLSEALVRTEASGASTSAINAVRFELALNAYDSARFDDALRHLEATEAHDGLGISDYNRATWMARTLSRLNRPEDAYARLARYYESRTSQERHHRMGELAFDLGMWERALEHEEALHGGRREHSWQLAFRRYLAGHHQDAERDFQALAERSSGQSEARYRYWQARTLEHLGRIEDAVGIYTDLTEDRPHGYYGLQAWNRLREWEELRREVGADGGWELPSVPASRPGRIHWNGPDGAADGGWSAIGAPKPDEFFGRTTESNPTSALGTLSAEWGAAFPSIRTAHALSEIGAQELARHAYRDAVIEFRALAALAERGRVSSTRRPIRLEHRLWEHYIDNRSDPRGWWGVTLGDPRYPVPTDAAARDAFVARQIDIAEARDELRPLFARAAHEVGDDYMVRRFAREAPLGPIEAVPPDPGWRDVFPRAYGPELRHAVEAYDMNPYLVWGLMIVESDMNPDSVSRADAYGLLQVIPKTGELVARGFGEVDFGIHALLEPSASLRYGTWYLNELLHKFRGQEMLALVAYNAGPHQVARWLQWRGSGMAMDEFIESVPYNGARTYPMRILQHMAMMRRVEGLPHWVYVGNTLDPVPEDNIYY
jgi:soluble lytic murein transglycosylase-like protein/tetratricopeptide (TPR) repeat protein